MKSSGIGIGLVILGITALWVYNTGRGSAILRIIQSGPAAVTGGTPAGKTPGSNQSGGIAGTIGDVNTAIGDVNTAIDIAGCIATGGFDIGCLGALDGAGQLVSDTMGSLGDAISGIFGGIF